MQLTFRVCWHTLVFAKWLRVCFPHSSFSLSPLLLDISVHPMCTIVSGLLVDAGCLLSRPWQSQATALADTSEMQNLGVITQFFNRNPLTKSAQYLRCQISEPRSPQYNLHVSVSGSTDLPVLTQAKPHRKHRFENGFGACHNGCLMIRPKPIALGFLSKTATISGLLLLLWARLMQRTTCVIIFSYFIDAHRGASCSCHLANRIAEVLTMLNLT